MHANGRYLDTLGKGKSYWNVSYSITYSLKFYLSSSSLFLFVVDVNHYSRSVCPGRERPGRKCYFTELCNYIQKHRGTSLSTLPGYTHSIDSEGQIQGGIP